MTAAFMVGLIVLLALVVGLVEVGALSYTYSRLGIDRRWAYTLLSASIVGARINVPIARFGGHVELSDTVVSYLGVRYLVPELVRNGQTVLAVNVGGALVPAALAGYLVAHAHLEWRALIAGLIVAAVVNRFARPLRGVGIVVPTLVSPVLAVLAAEAVGGRSIAALAYVAGTLGTLVGADLVNLPRIRRWGAPLVSIGGTGTFDGIFVTGIIAVLLAGR